MEIRLQQNRSGVPAVGVLEQYAGGTGNQWRTSVWLAAINASQTLDQSIADYEFLVKVGGHVDGPSAGMLMTATLLALMNGIEQRATPP